MLFQFWDPWGKATDVVFPRALPFGTRDPSSPHRDARSVPPGRWHAGLGMLGMPVVIESWFHDKQ